MMASITESLRKANRSTTLAVVYAGTIALFGGTTQYVVTWLVAVTGNVLSPAYYYMGATAIGVLGMLLMRESAPLSRSAASRLPAACAAAARVWLRTAKASCAARSMPHCCATFSAVSPIEI